MILIKKYYFLFSLILLISCENIDVIETDLPYEEIVVVRAQLEAGSDSWSVSFTKTLPLNTIYTIEEAEITDVAAELRIDDSEIIPLLYTGNGLYRSQENVTIEAGRKYELFATWNGKSIYSKTYVPYMPVVQNVVLENDFLRADVTAYRGVVYGATYAVAENPNTIYSESDDFYSIEQNTSQDPTQLITVRTLQIPDAYFQNAYYRDRFYIRVFAFDQPFLDYFKTQHYNNPIQNIFAQSGGPIIWNVEGDAIGMFIGLSITELIRAH